MAAHYFQYACVNIADSVMSASIRYVVVLEFVQLNRLSFSFHLSSSYRLNRPNVRTASRGELDGSRIGTKSDGRHPHGRRRAAEAATTNDTDVDV